MARPSRPRRRQRIAFQGRSVSTHRYKLYLSALALTLAIRKDSETVDTRTLFSTLSMPRALQLAPATPLGISGLIATGKITRRKVEDTRPSGAWPTRSVN